MTALFRRSGRRWLGVVTAAVLVGLVGAYIGVLEMSRPHVGGRTLRFNEFVDLVTQNQVQEVRILDEDSYLEGWYKPGPAVERSMRFNTPLLKGSQNLVLDLLLKHSVDTEIDQQVGKRVVALAAVLMPGLMLVVVFAYAVVSYRRGTGLFAKAGAVRRVETSRAGPSFDDVAGQDPAVAELRQIRDFLASPDRYAAVGALMPRGILLYGPPGCGKTLLARALANETGASFYSISGSDFVELYVGVGAARVRELFADARSNTPAIVFIDELDSIGKARGAGFEAHGEQEQALNQILTEMDGFSNTDAVMVLGATNRPDILDPALLRPGRFDRAIGLERPDESARLSILAIHARTRTLGSDVDLDAIASRAVGLTGADLANVLNEAALSAAREGAASVAQADLDRALASILEAPERQRRLSMKDRSIAKRLLSHERVTFDDLAGADEVIAELTDVRDYLTEPDLFLRMGALPPRGILLAGPPGCGKTLLARAVAGEANAAILAVSGSEFVEVMAGEGAARVRELFAEARSVAPTIVFIDEVDALGAGRSGAGAGGHREADQTLNQLLVELDGFQPRAGVIVIAATNRPDILDPALLRAGRIDRRIDLLLPDRSARRAILEVHARDKPLENVDLDVVADLCRGFSGADLANVLNEAALLAIRRRALTISMQLVEEAIDRATLGVGSGVQVLSEPERRVAAVHEAGHALVARALPGAPRPYRLSVVARPDALAHVRTISAADREDSSRSGLLDQIAVLLAGRVAEELVFGEWSSGSQGDLLSASELARRMVRRYGMGIGLGPAAYPDQGSGTLSSYSEEWSAKIDFAVASLLQEALERSRQILADAGAQLSMVADVLLKNETLLGDELDSLLGLPEAVPSEQVVAGR